MNCIGRIVEIKGTNRHVLYSIQWKNWEQIVDVVRGSFWVHEDPEGETSQSDRDDFEGGEDVYHSSDESSDHNSLTDEDDAQEEDGDVAELEDIK